MRLVARRAIVLALLWSAATTGPTAPGAEASPRPATVPTSDTIAPPSTDLGTSGASSAVPCAEATDTSEAVLAYSDSVEAEVGGTVTIDVALTLDLTATSRSLGVQGTSERVTVPCSLAAQLFADDGSTVRPSGSQFGTLSAGSVVRFRWTVTVPGANGTDIGISLGPSTGDGPEVFLDVAVQMVSASTATSVPVTLPSPGTGPANTTTVPSPSMSLPATGSGDDPEEESGEGQSAEPGAGSGGEPGGAAPDAVAPGATEPPVADTAGAIVNRAATEALAQCQQHVSDILDATIVYEPASTMTVGTTGSVKAVITLDPTATPELVFGSSAASVTAEPVQLPCKVEARVDALASDFEISPTTFEARELTIARNATWVWNVKPLRLGETTLTLVIRGKLSDGEVTNATPIRKTITVTALPGSQDSNGLPLFPIVAFLGLTGTAGVTGWTWRRRRSQHLGGPLPPPATPLLPGAPSLFVSYSRRDSEITKWLVADLEQAGYGVWRDTDDIRGGEKWRRSIVEGLRGSRVVVVLVSPHSVASANVERELSLAQDAGTQIIPVLIAPAAIPDAFQYLLAGVQMPDTTHMTRGQRAALVLNELAAILPPPPPPPPPPPLR